MTILRSWIPALPALVLSACASWFPAPVPMRSVTWLQPPEQPRAKCLVVLLPGMGDEAEDFERNGLVAEIKQRGLSIDMIAANATLGYYARGTFPERLASDVIGPARAHGYEQLWLIGNSMGGMGTLYYSRVHTDHVTGVLALAPYLGEDELIDEIYAQGGLARWRAPPRVAVMNEDNYQREIWRWLQAMTRGQEPGPVLYIGFGRSDKLARPDSLLAAALADDHKFTLEGAHDWPTWRKLLARFLDDSDLARDCRR